MSGRPTLIVAVIATAGAAGIGMSTASGVHFAARGGPAAEVGDAGTASQTDGWVQWRGPARDGIAPEFRFPEPLPDRPRRMWRLEVGIGHSSPVALGDRAWVHTRKGGDEVVQAVDLDDGQPVWQVTYPAPYRVNPAARRHGPGPKSTPVVAEGRLFTLGISGILSAFDATSGEPLWRHDFADRFRSTAPIYGTAMSPIVVDGRLVAHVGGDGDGALMAFDSTTGETLWSLDGHGPGYASPIVVQLGGVRHLVTQSQDAIVGVSLDDGALLWSLPFSTAFDQNIVTAVVWNDVLVCSGLDQGIVALQLEREAGGLRAREVWRNDGLSMYMSSPIVVGSRLFGFSHRRSGQFFAVDPGSGEPLWTSLGRDGENAALVGAGEHVLALTAGAELLVWAADGPDFTPLARWEVATSPTWAHPVPTARGLLVKDAETLTLWVL